VVLSTGFFANRITKYCNSLIINALYSLRNLSRVLLRGSSSSSNQLPRYLQHRIDRSPISDAGLSSCFWISRVSVCHEFELLVKNSRVRVFLDFSTASWSNIKLVQSRPGFGGRTKQLTGCWVLEEVRVKLPRHSSQSVLWRFLRVLLRR
jgi:hypothetical protein